ncbi:hypothetical protein GW17_00009304 [Ensete ventricosum]|nr:hypothetical protein GW17_00009304 [Ensete ventricosum]
MQRFDPLPCRRGPPNTLKVTAGAFYRDLSHAPVSVGAHSSATVRIKEVRVLKIDLEGALAYDGEAKDLPSIGEDQVAKGGGSLPCLLKAALARAGISRPSLEVDKPESG